MSKEIPIIRSHVLGPINSPFPTFFTSIHDLKHYCHPNSPLIFWAATANQRIPKKFQQFGPKFWDRSNGPSRPQINRNMEKPLKMGIKHKQGETPTSKSLKKLPNPGSTRCPRRVERLPFLLRRPPTVGFAVFLERSFSL